MYLFVRQPGSDNARYWVIRLSAQALKTLTRQSDQDYKAAWQLESRATGRLIYRGDADSDEANSADTQTVLLEPLTNSDWQLRGLFDASKARQALIAPLIIKCLIALLCSIVPLLALRSLRRLLAGASLPWRLGLGQLLRHPMAAAGQSLAFGLILLSMGLIALLRGELLDTWQNQLPKDAPNYFALNILPNDKDHFASQMGRLSSHSAPLYPMIPGRLMTINGEPVSKFVTKDSRGENATQRDLNLTWSARLSLQAPVKSGAARVAKQADVKAVTKPDAQADRCFKQPV